MHANANSHSFAIFPANPFAETAEISAANRALLNEHAANPDLLLC